MKFGKHLQVTPDGSGFEVRIYAEEGGYCTTNISGEDMSRLVEFVSDIQMARRSPSRSRQIGREGERILSVLSSLERHFDAGDVVALCPGLSRKQVNSHLRHLHESGKLIKTMAGKRGKGGTLPRYSLLGSPQ